MDGEVIMLDGKWSYADSTTIYWEYLATLWAAISRNILYECTHKHSVAEAYNIGGECS